MRTIGWVACVLVLASCGGGGSSETTGSSTETTSGGDTTASSVAWHDMTREQRGQFMAQTVLPEMRAIFQEADPEHFADFSCATCHGANAHDVDFHMPNGLAPLTGEQVQATFASQEPMAQLMTQRVWPRMAELLGEPQYDPQTHEGFSCFDCHAHADEAGATH